MESDKQRNWHQEVIKDDKIKGYLNYILKYQKEQLNWYEKKRRKRRIFSAILLSAAIILFSASLILPLIPGTISKVENLNTLGVYYAYGYIFLIATSMILLGDRLFGHSNGWIRYTLAYLQIDSVSSEFHSKWMEIIPQLEDESISNETRIAAIQLLRTFDTSLKNIVRKETEDWRNIFTNQLSEFSKKADSKLQDIKQEIADFKETTQKNITKYESVQLIIEFKNIPKGHQIQSKLFTSLDNPKVKTMNSSEPTWALKDIPIGDYLFDYLVESKDEKIRISRNDILSITGDVRKKKIEINLNTAENNG